MPSARARVKVDLRGHAGTVVRKVIEQPTARSPRSEVKATITAMRPPISMPYNTKAARHSAKGVLVKAKEKEGDVKEKAKETAIDKKKAN